MAESLYDAEAQQAEGRHRGLLEVAEHVGRGGVTILYWETRPPTIHSRKTGRRLPALAWHLPRRTPGELPAEHADRCRRWIVQACQGHHIPLTGQMTIGAWNRLPGTDRIRATCTEGARRVLAAHWEKQPLEATITTDGIVSMTCDGVDLTGVLVQAAWQDPLRLHARPGSYLQGDVEAALASIIRADGAPAGLTVTHDTTN